MQETERPEKMVTGLRQTKKALEQHRASRVWLACDAESRLTEPLLALCREDAVPVETGKTMQQLGKLCRIQVGCAAAAALSFQPE